MKRIITLMLLLVAFVGSTMAYEKGKLIERHVFRLMSPDDGDIGDNDERYELQFNGNALVSITQRGSFNSEKVQKQTYLNWFDNTARFIMQNPNGWIVGKNDRKDLGFGLMNNSGGYSGIRITGLKAGDIVRFEYFRNSTSVNEFPRFDNTNATHNGNQVSQNENVYGTDDYVIINNGDLDIQCPNRMLLRQVIITHANYKKATYEIKEVTKNGNKGYKYTITGSGVLEEKRGAVPYITMQFGNDDDMTVVRDFGNGNYAASCVIDDSHDLDITHDDVKINFNYKKRYQNQNGKYVRWANDDNHYNNVGDQNEQDAVKALAKAEAEQLKGQEWTIYRTSGYEWDNDKNWQLERSRAYKWKDNFADIWPLYGTYFYFFPEVNGKLSIKFYCEGNGQHIPFWWKAQDGEIKDAYVTGANNTTGTTIYELNDISVVRGGAYYLCANPTLIESEHPVARLISYEFIPDFKVEPLYKVVKNGTRSVSGACAITGGPFNDLTVDKTRKTIVNGEEAPEVKFLGNIEDADFDIRTEDGQQYLDITNITYKEGADVNKGGAICVNLHCTAGKATFVLTVAYSAEPAVWSQDGKDRVKDPDKSGKVVKKWDFYSNELAVGQYKDGSGIYPSDEWKASSLLYKEVNKFDGLTTDWVSTYADQTNEGKEPIFKSVYDMEGDNADMLAETEGLLFFTESNLLGIYNENDATGEFTARDRYIGLMGDGNASLTDHPRKLVIPFLKKDDRVVIKMGTYGNTDDAVTTRTATLRLTNALDAVGNEITGDYIIGGSGVAAGNDTNNGTDITDKTKPWGEYHFIVKANADDETTLNEDFAIEVKDASLLKLYSIVIYRHDNTILTENELVGNKGKRYILNTTEFTTSDNVSLHMHYRGLNEPMNYTEDIVPLTGNLEDDDVTPSQDENTKWYTYTVNKNAKKFGVFKARAGVKTIGEDYVTDYADCMIPVGYRETMTYPYTWDFTDLKKYTGAGISTASGSDGNEVAVTTYMTNDDDLKIWNEYGLRVTPEQWDGNIFVSGGQLYGGTTMFDETRGIGITHDNNNKVMTMSGDGTDLSGGLKVGNGTIGFIIPQVDKEQAIYVRATKVGGTQKATYEVSDGTTTYTYSDANATTLKSVAAQDESGDVIFAMAMADNLTKKCDVKLTFQGYEVKKIAVSDDFKQLSDNGWATESRNRIIDPELTSYMTGVPFENLVVTSFDYAAKTVGYDVVNAAAEGDLIPACTADGGPETYILHNTNGAAVEILNGGFHLFVPDMHDYFETVSNGSTTVGGLKKVKNMSSVVMKAQLNAGTVAREEDGYINFVLTDTWTHLKPDGTPYGRPETGEEAFYQVPKGGIQSGGHQGYLPVSKSECGNAPRFTFIFMGDDTTGIEETITTIGEENGENATYYNLNGQKISGVPTQRGIYIVNGKKIVKK